MAHDSQWGKLCALKGGGHPFPTIEARKFFQPQLADARTVPTWHCLTEMNQWLQPVIHSVCGGTTVLVTWASSHTALIIGNLWGFLFQIGSAWLHTPSFQLLHVIIRFKQHPPILNKWQPESSGSDWFLNWVSCDLRPDLHINPDLAGNKARSVSDAGWSLTISLSCSHGADSTLNEAYSDPFFLQLSHLWLAA